MVLPWPSIFSVFQRQTSTRAQSTNALLPDSSVGIEGDSGPAGAPEQQIEVTPEMIDIGVRIIRTYFDQPNDWFTRAIVEELLKMAMIEKKMVGPVDEIEITPEMIMAGTLVFLDYDSRFEEPADCVVDIFRKMLDVMGHREAVSDPISASRSFL